MKYPACVAGEQSDRCQRKRKTVSFVLDFLLGPWGWGWLLALTVKQPMWCLPSSLKTSAGIGDKNTFSFKPQSHPWTCRFYSETSYRAHRGVQTTGSSTGTLRQKKREDYTQHTAGVECRGREVRVFTGWPTPQNTDRVFDSCGKMGLSFVGPSRLFSQGEV